MDYISELIRDTRPLRDELMAHPVYRMVNSLENLRVFMQHHIFAVWDFMSLLKRLQQLQTGIDVPWLPKPNRTATRFINDIVSAKKVMKMTAEVTSAISSYIVRPWQNAMPPHIRSIV